jgi:hypothetical protein
VQQTTYIGWRKNDILKIGDEMAGSTDVNKNHALHA